MPLYEVDGKRPHVPEDGSVWIAPGARVIGDCRFAEGASVWFNAVIRADNEPTFIGRHTNIQDGAVLHNDPGFPLTIGDEVTVGHMAIVHGCTIGDGTLVGMGAMVMNGAVVGKGCLIGAGALIAEGKQIPDHSLVVGSPGKVVRTLDDKAIEMVRLASERYHWNRGRYAAGMKQLGPSV